MHLRSIQMKGFKSFPHRTRLDFSPGVGVVVGPNGSGKSNITDAVLWALGEQSPLAVRGQSMKDVIFAGGHGVSGSSTAEVEVVIDNSDGRSGSEFSEISIVRRLDRSGDGEYRLNGARCRLSDVVEVLSDTGLGKEMHSVVSQGRVESIVLSRPRERRLLIEEAAGLGKHRRRRRRAQLKLERTEANLARALDVEREARSRLRPLKRQAEAAQQHARLARQSDEARYALARDDLGRAGRRLARAEAAAAAARAQRDEAEGLLAAVAARRVAAEQAFAALTAQREELQGRLYSARSAAERIGIRLERARDQARAATEGVERRRAQLRLLEREPGGSGRDARSLAPGGSGRDARSLALDQAGEPAGLEGRITALEAELAELEGAREERAREELESLEREHGQAVARRARLEETATGLREALAGAEEEAESSRRERREAERAAEAARSSAATAGAELAAVNQFLRTAGETRRGAAALSAALDVEPGYETAVAAVLGPRLDAGVVDGRAAAEALLDRSGPDGGVVLLAGPLAEPSAGGPPCDGAERLLDRVRATGPAAAVLARLLGDVWLVASLSDLPTGFAGSAVTPAGRVLFASTLEVRQAPAGGPEKVLEQRNRHAKLVTASERAVRAEVAAQRALERAVEAVSGADTAREEADVALRRALREVEEAAESVRRTEWLMRRRREMPDEGPDAVRRAELSAEIRSERRLAESRLRERAEQERRAAGLRTRIATHAALATQAARAGEALEAASRAVETRVGALAAERAAGAEAGEKTAEALRACAHEEAEIQASLRAAGERVTSTEVAAQQTRDGAADAEVALIEVAGRLGLEPEPSEPALDEGQREELSTRIERLTRRREQLGPVNPLAAEEYEEAVAHVEELEGQRSDLEGALAELAGLLRDTDRRIRDSFEETFEAAGKNFEEVVAHLFPGGRGRLRLVREDRTPRPVLGGEDAPDEGPHAVESDAVDEPTARAEQGVEIEVTPAGKSTKRLSLMSGGEKSLVALAFMFAVFLARPCPFYILDEVEAALDDFNIDRFLALVRRYSDRAQFIVVTHQKRTMDAADRLYGVSMGGDGVSHVVSRRLGARAGEGSFSAEAPAAARTA